MSGVREHTYPFEVESDEGDGPGLFAVVTIKLNLAVCCEPLDQQNVYTAYVVPVSRPTKPNNPAAGGGVVSHIWQYTL